MYRLCLFFAFIFFAAHSFAQQKSYFDQPDKNGVDKVFFGGIALGINASQIDGDYFSGFHKAGLNAGFLTYVKLKKNMLASIELLYSQKGARNVTVQDLPATGSTPITYYAKLNYAEVPLMFNYVINDRFVAGAGVSYSRLFSDKEYLDYQINDVENTFVKQDLNYLFSLAYQLSGNLFARARYQYSIVTIREAQNIHLIFGTPAQFNNLVALQFFLLF